jgi:8-oxo-dGTP diphosphatase
MPRLLLVRHARAGARGHGPSDLDRPLDVHGSAQADALVDLLVPLLDLGRDARSEVRSSPARRCIETVTPLAAALGTPVTVDDMLVEGSDARPLLERIAALTVPTVWSSHGDVIPELLALLARRGVDLGEDLRCRKGSTWVLDVDGGEVTVARPVQPPL